MFYCSFAQACKTIFRCLELVCVCQIVFRHKQGKYHESKTTSQYPFNVLQSKQYFIFQELLETFFSSKAIINLIQHDHSTVQSYKNVKKIMRVGIAGNTSKEHWVCSWALITKTLDDSLVPRPLYNLQRKNEC